MLKKLSFYFSFLFFLHVKVPAQIVHTQVLVVGGTASGVSAGIQSARLGVSTLIMESTSWLGGMITSAGVSAFDGNHLMPSGLFGEFRNQLYKVYGGPKQVETGWVSNTLFEPHVGDSIFKIMARQEKKLQVKYKYEFKEAITKGLEVVGAIFVSTEDATQLTVYANRIIDATELGDVMASAHIPYNVGMESYKETGENVHIPATSNVIQDITHVAILKDFGFPQPLIARPVNYDSTEFDGSNTNFYRDSSRKKPSVDAKKMLDYGRLPNNKYMLNWPIYGNDIYLNVVEQNKETRLKMIEEAKQQTLRFVYFIQKELGFKNYALAKDEFPTHDQLAFYPYYRESRRLKGIVRMKVQHIATPFETEEPLYRTGIAVGDYPIDHHHKKNPSAPQHLDFYPVPSFNIALGTLIPQKHKNIIVAEKSISVSNVVNGTTRLQPCVLQIGQAAGMLAALSVLSHKQPIDVPVRWVQEKLLAAGIYIMPYMDLQPNEKHFIAAQKLGAIGLVKGNGVPSGWANKTFFKPFDKVNTKEVVKIWLLKFPKEASRVATFSQENLTLQQALLLSAQLSHQSYATQLAQVKNKWSSWEFSNFDLTRAIQRIEFAVILNEVNAFKIFKVNHSGNFIP